MPHTNWRPDPDLERKNGREVWTHEAPHRINDAERDGDISFSDEVLEGFRDDEDED